MKRAPLILAAAVLAAGCRLWSSEFRVSGTVTLASGLHSRLPRNNSVLFIVASNLGGVPVAVRRVVNPQFPVSFTLGEEDLVVPGSRPPGPLRLEAQMNTHGHVGRPAKGDFGGYNPDPVEIGAGRVYIVVDSVVP